MHARIRELTVSGAPSSLIPTAAVCAVSPFANDPARPFFRILLPSQHFARYPPPYELARKDRSADDNCTGRCGGLPGDDRPWSTCGWVDRMIGSMLLNKDQDWIGTSERGVLNETCSSALVAASCLPSVTAEDAERHTVISVPRSLIQWLHRPRSK